MQPARKRPASQCTEWIANAVLPTPAMPSIAHTTAHPEDVAAPPRSAASLSSSATRPVKWIVSPGRPSNGRLPCCGPSRDGPLLGTTAASAPRAPSAESQIQAIFRLGATAPVSILLRYPLL